MRFQQCLFLTCISKYKYAKYVTLFGFIAVFKFLFLFYFIML